MKASPNHRRHRTALTAPPVRRDVRREERELMGIRAMLKQWAYRKRVRGWPERAACVLDVALNPPSVNGLRFHSHFDEARKLGRPVATVKGAGSSVRLDFPSQGITLEYEADRLAYIGIVVSPENEEAFGPGMASARATLKHGFRMVLSPEIKAEEILELLGRPVEDDSDECERILTHQINGYTVESEFTPRNRLKRVNIFPSFGAEPSASGEGRGRV